MKETSKNSKEKKSSEEIADETMQEFYEAMGKKDEEKVKQKDEEESGSEQDSEDDTDELDVHFVDIDSPSFDKQEVEDEPTEEELAEKAAEKKKKRKRLGIVLGSIFGVLLVAYCGISIFFMSHLFFNTKINDIDFAMKNAEEVETYMAGQVDDYQLTLMEANNQTEVIDGQTIALEYVKGNEVEQLINDQNPFLWPVSLFKHPNLQAKIGVKYDEKALTSAIDNLKCLVEEGQVPSEDAKPVVENGTFVIKDEVYGTQINKEDFVKKVEEAINGFHKEIDMAKDVYLKPKFTKDSSEVIAATKEMNSRLGVDVTYDFNPHQEKVDAEKLEQWLKTDENMAVYLDEEAVRGFVNELAAKYNTYGQPLTMVSSGGREVTVPGGSFGWEINIEEELATLLANIANKEVVTREPVYSQRAVNHEGVGVGNTYAEVDLTAQKLYFVQDGQVVINTEVTTGNPNKGWETPPGLFFLNYKTTNTTLRGKKMPDGSYEYESPVNFWMPFNGGIGFHDAPWQPRLGGDWYLTNGSRGCINMNYDAASQLYNLIQSGTPVLVYY
ncbi:vancomycin resistance protein YoaR [Lachnospiraceae bacterium PFB1-21]